MENYTLETLTADALKMDQDARDWLLSTFRSQSYGFKRKVYERNQDLFTYISSFPGKDFKSNVWYASVEKLPLCPGCNFNLAKPRESRWGCCSTKCAAKISGLKQRKEEKIRDVRRDTELQRRLNNGVPDRETIIKIALDGSTSAGFLKLKNNYPLFWNIISGICEKENLKPSEAIYRYAYPDFSNICSRCNKTTSFKSFSAGYRPYCSSKCLNNDPKTQAKREETNLKIRGVRFPMQDFKSHSSQQRSSFSLKTAIIEGKEFVYQGDELNVIKWFLQHGVNIDQINKPSIVIPWTDKEGKQHYHHCDLLIENSYVEVKSPWTLKVDKDSNIRKLKAAKLFGLDYFFAVWMRNKKNVYFLDNENDINRMCE